MADLVESTALRRVLSKFSLEHPRVEGELEASTMNENVLVADATGKRFVLRRHRRNPDAERVAFQLRFQDFLFGEGYPVAEIVRTRDGQLLALDSAGPFGLFGFVEGEHYDFERLTQATEAGRRLAQFHVLTERFEELEASYPLREPVREWWTSPESILEEVGALLGEGVQSEIAYVREWVARLQAELPLEHVDALPVGWCHLDYHGRNLIFDGDEVRALLDFDKLQRGPYVLDLERGVFMFGRRERGSAELRLDAVDAFLSGYEEARVLSSAERRAIVVVMGWDALPFPAMVRLFQREGNNALDDFRGDISRLRARRLNAAELAEHLST